MYSKNKKKKQKKTTTTTKNSFLNSIRTKVDSKNCKKHLKAEVYIKKFLLNKVYRNLLE